MAEQRTCHAWVSVHTWFLLALPPPLHIPTPQRNRLVEFLAGQGKLLIITSQHPHTSPPICHFMPHLPTGCLRFHLPIAFPANDALLALLAPLPSHFGNMAHLCWMCILSSDGDGSPSRLPRNRVVDFRFDRHRRLLRLFLPSNGIHDLLEHDDHCRIGREYPTFYAMVQRTQTQKMADRLLPLPRADRADSYPAHGHNPFGL